LEGVKGRRDQPRLRRLEADITGGRGYGYETLVGPIAPFKTRRPSQKVLALLDGRSSC